MRPTQVLLLLLCFHRPIIKINVKKKKKSPKHSTLPIVVVVPTQKNLVAVLSQPPPSKPQVFFYFFFSQTFIGVERKRARAHPLGADLHSRRVISNRFDVPAPLLHHPGTTNCPPLADSARALCRIFNYHNITVLSSYPGPHVEYTLFV